MNRRFAVAICAAVFFSLAPSEARINLFEPWQPGVDTSVGMPYSCQPSAYFVSGERFFEIPAQFTYVSGPGTEVGGRWGIRSVSGNTGISDLLIGMKYQFTAKKGERPGIAGEAAVSLPTADYGRGLGTGAAALLLNWALEKDVRNVTGYFSLDARLNAENSDRVQEGNMFSYRLGAGWPYRERWRFFGEIKGFNHGKTKIAGTAPGSAFQELYLAPGMTYAWTPRRTVSAALLLGLTTRSSTLGFLAGCTF